MVPMALALTSTLRLGWMVPEQLTMAIRSFCLTFWVSTLASALSPDLRMETTTAIRMIAARGMKIFFFTLLLLAGWPT